MAREMLLLLFLCGFILISVEGCTNVKMERRQASHDPQRQTLDSVAWAAKACDDLHNPDYDLVASWVMYGHWFYIKHCPKHASVHLRLATLDIVADDRVPTSHKAVLFATLLESPDASVRFSARRGLIFLFESSLVLDEFVDLYVVMDGPAKTRAEGIGRLIRYIHERATELDRIEKVENQVDDERNGTRK